MSCESSVTSDKTLKVVNDTTLFVTTLVLKVVNTSDGNTKKV